MKWTVVCFCAVLSTGVLAQELEAYKLYNKEGKEVDFGKMSKDLSKQDVVLFGELHNDPIGHWLQLELSKALDNEREIVLGAEWFERDDQVIINEYLSGAISIDHLKKESKVWPNYDTDYKPILEFAREEDLRFIATNVPRRYASLVSKKGMATLDSLEADSKTFIPPLPYDVTENDTGYAEMRSMMGHGHGGMNVEFMIEAQALKDYTMAESIMENRADRELFLHFNGSFHSHKYSGIVGYLRAVEPDLKVSIIASTSSASLDWNEEWEGLGDYILVVDQDMTKTH